MFRNRFILACAWDLVIGLIGVVEGVHGVDEIEVVMYEGCIMSDGISY